MVNFTTPTNFYRQPYFITTFWYEKRSRRHTLTANTALRRRYFYWGFNQMSIDQAYTISAFWGPAAAISITNNCNDVNKHSTTQTPSRQQRKLVYNEAPVIHSNLNDIPKKKK